ncbi:MAG: HEPN domain-containing protein [Cyanobium sp.]|jgi:HEPN domain-containing protein
MPAEGRRPDASLMLRIAHRDLKAARGMLDEDGFDEATWGYHIQQATEKALKAWISCLGQDYPRTHDLLLLFGLISDLGGDPSPFQQLVNFSPFGTRLRYDEEEPLGLERSLWNERCADLLAHVALLIR